MNSNTPNRIARSFPPIPVPEPPRLTVGDVLLAKAWGIKIEMLRFPADDGDEAECSCEIEIKSTIEGEKPELPELLANLLESFRRGGEGQVGNG